MLVQQHSEELERAIAFPVSDSSALSPELPNSTDRALKALTFDASGVPTATPLISGTATVSTYGASLIDDADNDAARTTLGLEGFFARNAIINGNLDVWQRGTSFASAPNGTYGVDRFQWAQVGAGVIDILRSENVPDETSNYSLQIDVTTADASIAASDKYYIRYAVEGYDARRFAFGTSDAKEMTLSFYAYSTKTGTHCVAFQNSAGNRSYVAEYTINALNTWEKKTITLTADTAGTWLYTNGVGLNIYWVLASGTNFHGTADSWAGANDIATSNQVNCLDSISNNFRLAQVQLEVGADATEFGRRPIGDELARCQRYYWQSAGANWPQIQGASHTTNQLGAFFAFPVEMRDTPTVAVFGTWNFSNCGSLAVASANRHGTGVTVVASAAGNVLAAPNSSDDFVTADAEL